MKKIQVHGHRGSRGTHPENTIAGFTEAARVGAEFVELDVHLTRENELVVFHDFEISGLPISDLSLTEIKQRNPAVPSLEEVAVWRQKSAPQLKLNVEIKRGDPSSRKTPSADLLASQVVGLLKRAGLLNTTLVQSFDFEVVRAVRKRSPELKLSTLFESPADFAQIAHENGSQVAAPYYKLVTQEVLKSARSLGVEILPWTVNEPADWERLIALGVGGIITDYPEKLVHFI